MNDFIAFGVGCFILCICSEIGIWILNRIDNLRDQSIIKEKQRILTGRISYYRALRERNKNV